jgi:hypothetical protein
MTRDGVGIELRRGVFDISVDGNSVGSVDRHDTVETQVEPGRHTVQSVVKPDLGISLKRH